MENIILFDENVEINAMVIRYFKYNNNYYLIYTLGEKDEKNYQKLYLVQILEELGEKVTRNIIDDEEWHEIQNMVKDSIKQIKAGNDDNIAKINSSELNEIRVNNPRFFKLDSKLVELLKADIDENILESGEMEMVYNGESNINADFVNNDDVKNEMPLKNENVISEVNTSTPIVEDVDYKELYFLIKADKEATEALLDEVMQELALYKQKYGELVND